MPETLPTQLTLQFLERHLPARKARLLEVGCGHGELAKALAGRGFQVTALDKSSQMVASARALGVAAVEGDFLLYRAGPFDAVVFSRSLHHLYPLDEALERAGALLAPGGWLILDEFGVDRVDRPTARWLYDTQGLLEAAGLATAREWDSPQTADPLERWRVEHDFDPPIHTAPLILESVKSRFELRETRDVAYLYRHLHDRLERGERTDAIGKQIHAVEERLVAERALRPVGLRIVAQRRT